jgi:hypothetical protein
VWEHIYCTSKFIYHYQAAMEYQGILSPVFRQLSWASKDLSQGLASDPGVPGPRADNDAIVLAPPLLETFEHEFSVRVFGPIPIPPLLDSAGTVVAERYIKHANGGAAKTAMDGR